MASCLFLAGCPGEQEVLTQIVKVPVFQCPITHQNIQTSERPSLFIDSITEEDANDPGKVVKSYKATVKQLQGYSKELENNINAYKQMCEGNN